MFLRQRATQAEYFDAPERTEEELRLHYAWLARMNRLTRFERPFRVWLPRLLGRDRCGRLSLVDLGAGDGSLGKTLSAWARTQGWEWSFTNVDLCPPGLDQSGVRHVTANVTALPFADGEFDVAIATTMTHHLNTDAAVIRHFQEAGRVARRAVLICDMQRNPLFLAGLWLTLIAVGAPGEFRRDGVLSVRRGWRVPEWRHLADQAGLPQARVWSEHGAHVLLAVAKS